ncbi:MAG: beta-N-acetylhexosaminidase [Archangiaceae bacterium]|nr:beta-N-acetylhexosaminidase [Archangiaceae bacterium]
MTSPQKVDALWRRCAGLFMVGFDGTAAPASMLQLIDDGVYGAILFKRNVETPQQVASLVRALKTRAGRPFVLAVDQEGGRVARLRGPGFTALPPMRELGRRDDAALAKRAGRLLAYELRSLGFDWDFAPVLDVDTNPANPVIGDRSFGADAARVSKLGVALGQGLEEGGVAACGKHFPGHGDTATDSHLALPRLPHDLARLRQVELPPFAAFARAGLASLMTAHVVFEALEPSVPATMSKKVLVDLMRNELGFSGVLVSDDLEMKAIAQHYSIERAVIDGVNATVDLFLVCHDPNLQRQAIDALYAAVRDGRVSETRLDEASARLTALARRFARGPEDLVARLGSAEHQALAAGLDAGAFAGRDPTER